MFNAKYLSLLTLLLVLFSSLSAQTGPSAARREPVSENVSFFPLSELKEGMRGTARTVFRGSESEEFAVEIIGILPGGIGPKQDLIVGRIGGGSADRTSVFAGMSGSPVYIDGRLVGAISYSFPFAKEPICGITPIEQMIAIFEQKEALRKSAESRALSFAELVATTWAPDLPTSIGASANPVVNANSRLASVAGQSFEPIATPVSFGGFSQKTLDFFSPQLLQAGLLPVSAAGGSAGITPLKRADETTLVGGDSVSMHLTRGDFSLAASGTVTYRDGDKIYAFGHPFLGLGTSDLPMSESHVVTVIPNINNSFKLAVPDAMVGSMTQDRATGVLGKLGKVPAMIPVTINIQTSRGRQDTFKMEVAKDDFLTPLLLNMAVYNTIVANERGLGDSLVSLSGEIRVKDHEPLKVERRFSGPQASQLASGAVAVPVSALLKSRFDDLEIAEVVLNLASTDGSKTAVLERIALDRSEVRAGETLEVQAFVRTDTGKIFVQRIPVTVPLGTPAGPISVTLGDGNTLQHNAAIQQFVPKNLRELIQTVNKIKLPDRLYVQTYRTTNGAIIGANELPNLPPSVLATLNNDRSAGSFKPVVQTVVTEQVVPPAEFIISGQQTLVIQVLK